MLQTRERAVEATSSVHAGIELPLRFGYSPFVNHKLTGEAVRGYREIVPGGRIDPSSDCSATLVTMVAEGHLDAALISMPLAEKGPYVHQVCREKVLLCLRCDDPLATAESIPREILGDRLQVLFARSHHPLFYEELRRKFAKKAGIRLRPSNFVSSPAEMQFLVKMCVGFGLVRDSTPLDPELTRRSIPGLVLHVKTAFICHPAQQRPVLPLLAYRLAKMCFDQAEVEVRKRPKNSLPATVSGQLRVLGKR